MPFKILLIAGHGAGDPGACANGFQEQERVRALVMQVASRIKGAQVDIYDFSKNCVKECKKGNVPAFADYDYVIEFHLNASQNPTAHGSMFYLDQSETGHSVEDKILEEMQKVGYDIAWDGVVKTQVQFAGGLVVQNRCRAAGTSHALLETCFITNKEDMDRLNSMLAQTAQAVANGIMRGFNLDENAPVVEDAPTRVPDSAESFSEGLAGSYKITAPDFLWLRYTPGVISKDNEIMKMLPGTIVRCYGYYTKVGGIKWLYVRCGDKEGFASKVYLKKV